jgi:hypothetical protein
VYHWYTTNISAAYRTFIVAASALLGSAPREDRPLTDLITTPAGGQATASPTPAATRTRAARALLACGVVAGPLYLTVGLAQALTRDGFDLGRHALSLLANGELGWIQIGNFLVAGLLAIAAAVGMRRVLGGAPGGTWGPRLVGAYGAGLVAAAVFRADPTDGFPPGTPAGPGQATWHGMLHLASFGIGFLCLIVACFAVAGGLAALGERGSARVSRLSGVVVLGAVAASFATTGTSAAVVAVWVAVVVAWAWLAVTAARLRARTSPATRA